MSNNSSLRERAMSGARGLARRFTGKARLRAALSPYLPPAVCVDVGAAYYPHAKWHLFLASPQTHWVAVEPNKANIGYIDQWPWASRVSSCTTGLSREGGPKTLYITNVDSGSSLLEPVVPPGLARRIRNLDYFFPLRTQQIDTVTLSKVIADVPSQAPVFVKLDTQGTELSILSGAEELIRSQRILGIELESTLLAQPIMQGSGKFWEAAQYLENLGMELLHLHPIYGPSRIGLKRNRGLTFINECDAIFAVRPDIAAGLPVEHRAGVFTFYLCNRLFEEALIMLAEDRELRDLLAARGCALDRLDPAIRALA